LANFVVFIEHENGRPTAPSRFATAEARRAADVFGATVYALVAGGPLEVAALEALPATLGGAGADKVLVCGDPGLAGPPVDAVLGELVALVAAKLRPLLFVFPAGGVALQLGPPLALRLGAVYFPGAVLGIADAADEEPRFLLARAPTGPEGRRLVDLADCERAAVIVLPAGDPPEATAAVAELDVLAPPPPRALAIEELEAEPDPTAPVARASTVVVAPSDREAAALAGDGARAAPDARAVAVRLGDEAVAISLAALEAAAGRLLQACPAHLVCLAPAAGVIAALRPAPGASVAVLGAAGAPAPSPIVNVVWTVGADEAVARLREELGRTRPAARRGEAEETRR
jgi:hypothetical protein